MSTFPATPGLLLDGGRWQVLRKLGTGPRSSTWLVVDSEDSNHIVALKIFTVQATISSSVELRLLEDIKRARLYQFPVLHESFVETSPQGEHLCVALDLLGPSVEDFRKGRPLSVHIVQKMAADVLEALCALHDRGIIHGAVSSDNFLFAVPQQGPAIQLAIANSPTGNGDEPQPINPPHSWLESRTSFANASIQLNNLGHAQEVKTVKSLDAPSHILPPEALLGGHIDVKADIWMLGCATYLLLSGTPLFAPSLSVLEHLAQMLTLHANITKFGEGMLNRSPRRNELFHHSGELRMEVSPAQSLEDLLSVTLPTSDVPSAAAFIRACLTLDPEERLDAHALIGHEWVQQGEMCDCKWCVAEN